MKIKMLLVLLGALVVVSGCVTTPAGTKEFALTPGKDSFESRYERTPDQVYAAALEVLKANGTVTRETTINPGPTARKAIEAKVNGRNVSVGVEAVDSKVTSVVVLVRTKGGGTDLDLTQQISTQIGIKLASR